MSDEDEPVIIIEKRRVKIRRHTIQILTCLDGKYQIWKDERDPHDPKRWRWALREWPDDGLGISHYGAGRDLEAAVRACIEHDNLWQNLKNLE